MYRMKRPGFERMLGSGRASQAQGLTWIRKKKTLECHTNRIKN